MISGARFLAGLALGLAITTSSTRYQVALGSLALALALFDPRPMKEVAMSTPTEEPTDRGALAVGVLILALIGVWALHLTGAKWNDGPGVGPLGIPALADYAAAHVWIATGVIVAVICTVAVATTSDEEKAARA